MGRLRVGHVPERLELISEVGRDSKLPTGQNALRVVGIEGRAKDGSPGIRRSRAIQSLLRGPPSRRSRFGRGGPGRVAPR